MAKRKATTDGRQPTGQPREAAHAPRQPELRSDADAVVAVGDAQAGEAHRGLDDFILCETPTGERISLLRTAIVGYRQSPYRNAKPRQLIILVHGQAITINESPQVRGSREQAERWVMR